MMTSFRKRDVFICQPLKLVEMALDGYVPRVRFKYLFVAQAAEFVALRPGRQVMLPDVMVSAFLRSCV
jgi:hypothetical protein